MMCDFIARINWPNIENNYFMDTIIIFDLSYYTNIMITVTFGAVHAYVDQKLVKSNKLRVLIEDRNMGLDTLHRVQMQYGNHSSILYSVSQTPQQIIYSPFLSPSLLFDMSYPY